jgi:hypothetical protein
MGGFELLGEVSRPRIAHWPPDYKAREWAIHVDGMNLE